MSNSTAPMAASGRFGELHSTGLDSVGAVLDTSMLDDLDPDQRHAVTTESTMVAVIAGAGSGKTRVLTRRIAHRVVNETADPRHTLVLTFTREAAGELRRRLPRLGLRERVEAGTFHSVMLGMLRQHWSDRGREAPTVVSERRRLIVEAVGRSGIDELVAEIDWAAARGITPESYVAEARAAARRVPLGHTRVAEAYERYRTLKRRRGVIDLDDVLAMSVDLLDRDALFAEVVAWRYRHLLVDEAQDLNPLQHRLVDQLRAAHQDVFLVGDPAQAVYGFNGADPTLLIDVADRFPGIEIVRLTTNHRCTPEVVGAGVHVLGAGSMEATATTSSRAHGAAVQILACADHNEEAAKVVRVLASLDPGHMRTGSVAVLARTHAQLAALTESFAASGIRVRRRVDGPGSPYRAAIEAAIRQGSSTRLRAWAHDLLDGLGEDDRRADLTEEALEVASAVLDFLREQPLGDGTALRAWIATTDPFGARDPDGVDLITFHAAKGREWATVIVTGVETGLVPHRSASTLAARAEEARLLYVALTRARDQLIITWAQRRGGYKRRRSPLIEAFEPTTPEVIAPPAALRSLARRTRPATTVVAELRQWRDRCARSVGILPEQFCPDAALRAINDQRPASPEELASATGFGILTARRWYPGVQMALAAAQDSRSTTTGA